LGDVAHIIIFFAALAAVVAVLIYRFYTASKRRDELALLAMKMGCEFHINDPFNIAMLYDGFDCISCGHDREASNVIVGRVDNRDFKAFDCSYKTSSGKSEAVHRLSAIVLDTDVAFPGLLIRLESVFDRLAGAIGFDDIDFESDEFSRRFYVKSDDKKFAYDVIHEKMMEFLMADPRWGVQMLLRSVMVYTGSTFTVEEFSAGIEFLREFMGLLPDYLWQTLRGSGRSR